VITFSQKWVFWAVQTGSIQKKILKLKYATFEGGFSMFSWAKKTFKKNSVDAKGQLISKCPFGVIVWTKIPTKNLTNFCPRIKKVVKSTK
jgi:hypothetical protein